jgi:RNA polymerase sigma-70 factor (ECF subfamily)
MISRDAALHATTAAAAPDADTAVAFRLDEDAFRGFYDRTSRMLWLYLRRLTGDAHQADDLLQEAYYRFLRADVPLESEAHRRHYLFRIATNLVRDGVRRTQARPRIVSHEQDVAAEGSTSSAAGLDRRLAVNDALSSLGRRERALLWLAYAQGASHQEIAAIVGVKAASVKSLLYRARRRMAALLEGRGPRS